MSCCEQGGRHELARLHVRRELRESQRQSARLEATDKADLAVYDMDLLRDFDVSANHNSRCHAP
jgi:hypothetical protein